MEKEPRMIARKIITVLEKHGFVFSRQSGSQAIYKKENMRVTVPRHGNKILHPKVLRSIMKDADISQEILRKLL